MSHKVFGNLLQTVIASDEMVLTGELPLQLCLLVVTQVGGVNNFGDVLGKVLIHELEFGDAVLVIERDGVAIINRLLEVVDGDVVAEDLLRALLASHERRSSEADERGIRQSIPHVQCEGVVLAPVRLVGDDDDVRSVGEFRVLLAILGAELLNQREHVAVVFSVEQLLQDARHSEPGRALPSQSPHLSMRNSCRSGRRGLRGR